MRNLVFLEVNGGQGLRLSYAIDHDELDSFFIHVHAADVQVDERLGLRY